MGNGFIVHKTSTCKSFDTDYLDETSGRHVSYQSGVMKVSEDKVRSDLESSLKAIDYLDKEDVGRVFAGGYLRYRILSGWGPVPEKWDNVKYKQAIRREVKRIVRQHGDYRGAYGHRLVFSVSNDLQEKVEKAGLNLDHVMADEVKKVMGNFQKKFHPGERIAYAFGVHHDTDNRHIHVFLCNRTDKGNHVAFSNPLKNKTDKRLRLDQIGYAKAEVVKAQVRMEKLAESAVENINKVPLKYLSGAVQSRHTSQLDDKNTKLEHVILEFK